VLALAETVQVSVSLIGYRSSAYSRKCWIGLSPRFICVYLRVFCAFVFHTAYMLCYCQHSGGGSSGIEAQSLGSLFLQCFNTVGWVF